MRKIRDYKYREMNKLRWRLEKIRQILHRYLYKVIPLKNREELSNTQAEKARRMARIEFKKIINWIDGFLACWDWINDKYHKELGQIIDDFRKEIYEDKPYDIKIMWD